jgi:hypothetical protein
MIQMDVLGGYDDLVEVVLQFHQSVGKLSLVMIVDEHDGPRHFLSRSPFVFHQTLPDEVSDGLGAGGIVLGSDEGVELLQEILGERDAESADTGHG